MILINFFFINFQLLPPTLSPTLTKRKLSLRIWMKNYWTFSVDIREVRVYRFINELFLSFFKNRPYLTPPPSLSSKIGFDPRTINYSESKFTALVSSIINTMDDLRQYFEWFLLPSAFWHISFCLLGMDGKRVTWRSAVKTDWKFGFNDLKTQAIDIHDGFSSNFPFYYFVPSSLSPNHFSK